MEMTFSKRAIYLAAISDEYGSRLVQIAREHCSLAVGISNNIRAYGSTGATREDLEKIEQLRKERQEIILRFEEDRSVIG